MMDRLFICICILLCMVANEGISQINNQFNNPNLPFNNQNVILPDSINEADTIINKNGFLSLFKGKPGKAALYSLVIPGGGQAYNKKWWKVPLAIGVDGGLLYNLTWQAKKYDQFQKAYTQSLNDPKADPNTIANYKSNRDQFRKWSEYAWLFIIGGHLLTVVDAYVDRHLVDFDVSDDLSYSESIYIPNPIVAKIGMNISLNKNQTKTPNPDFLRQVTP